MEEQRAGKSTEIQTKVTQKTLGFRDEKEGIWFKVSKSRGFEQSHEHEGREADGQESARPPETVF